MVTNQVLTPEEVAESRYGGDEWSMDTKLDIDLRQKVAEAHQKFTDAQVAEGKLPTASAAGAVKQQQAVETTEAWGEQWAKQHQSDVVKDPDDNGNADPGSTAKEPDTSNAA
jgi:hypothetical protein